MVKEIHVPKTLRESVKNYLAIKRAQKYQMEQKKHGLSFDFKKSYQMSYLKRLWKHVKANEFGKFKHKWDLVMSVPIRTTPTRIRFK